MKPLLFKVYEYNCYTMLNDLVSGSQYFVHNFPKKYDFQGVTEKYLVGYI